MGAGAERNVPCACGSGKKYKKCCMGKMTTRTCPRCKKPNEIPEESRKFQCAHCGAKLTKVDRPSIIEVANLVDPLDMHLITRALQDFLAFNFVDTAIPDEKMRGVFLEKQMKVVRSLWKANKHLRDYRKDEETEMARLGKANADAGTHSYVGGMESIELEADWDAYLVQLKAALDSLSGAMNVLLGTNFDRWAKGTDKNTGKKMSGQKILNRLKDIQVPSPEIKALITFIEANLQWATYIVELRDKPVHQGQTIASAVLFNPELNMTQKAKIVHGKDQAEDITAFMERTLKDMVAFVRMITYLGINHRMDKGFKIGVDEQDQFVIYFPPVEQ